MNASAWARLVADDRGGVIAFVAVCLPVLVLFAAFVLDVGNWFVHKRDLQLQADAAALAGGGRFTIPCSNDAVEAEARTYSGDAAAAYNTEKPAVPASTHVLVNSVDYWENGGTDYSDGGRPCETKFLDVKLTEADIPLFFGSLPGFDGVLPGIGAHARVEIRALEQTSGALPVGVPELDPKAARAWFVNEATGATIASTPLAKAGVASGLQFWDNSAAPVKVPISADRIGVRIALAGGTSTTCGDALVECYDLGSANGLVHIRGWSTSGSGAQPNPPLARGVSLVTGSCSDPYFSSPSTPCSTIGVVAKVDFGPAGPAAVGARVSAVVDGAEKPLTYSSSTDQWSSSASALFSVPSAAGPVPVELKWEETRGSMTIGGRSQTCSTGGGNKCKDTFGPVQRTFSAHVDRSGPVELAQVWEDGVAWADSFERGSEPSLTVKIGVKGTLHNATSVSEPIVALRVTGSGSSTQSIDCDPALSNLREELANGCAPLYEVNDGATACPATATQLWQPQPPAWNCVATQTGAAIGQVSQGMSDRILDGSSTCTNPNNWYLFPDIPEGDPRIVSVFLTPFGSFSGSGNAVVPVTSFGTFYVTGWHGSPCTGGAHPDDPVPGNGYVVGHFIKHVFDLNNGGGGNQPCDFTSFGSCLAVLTE